MEQANLFHGNKRTTGTSLGGSHNCYPLTMQVLRDRFQATGTIKDRHRSHQPRITARRPDATLAVFFVLWHYTLCVKIKGEQSL